MAHASPRPRAHKLEMTSATVAPTEIVTAGIVAVNPAEISEQSAAPPAQANKPIEITGSSTLQVESSSDKSSRDRTREPVSSGSTWREFPDRIDITTADYRQAFTTVMRSSPVAWSIYTAVVGVDFAYAGHA